MRGVIGLVVGAIISLGTPGAGAETVLEAPGPLGPLRGTFLAATRRDAPIVLIIPGSGPTDRNGNGGEALQASSYRLMAEGLAQNGISSLRIDKRGMFDSAKAVADANAVTIPDYAVDVEAWIKVIKHSTKQNCVWLLGHSEGGLVALVVAQKSQDLCGLLLVATPGRPLGDVLLEQLKANPANAPIIEQASVAISHLASGQKVDTRDLHPALAALFDPSLQGFMISLFSYDPAKLAGNYNGPKLILHGKRDIQVGKEDARRLADADKSAKLIFLDDTNHMLKRVQSDDLEENVAAYTNPKLPLAEGVIKALADFVTSKN